MKFGILLSFLTVQVCSTLAQDSDEIPDLSLEQTAPDGAFSHESVSHASSSLPKLDNSEYSEIGEVLNLGDLPIYLVGSGEKCIVWNYDIFGFDTGRTRQLCDYFANQGYMVVLPDYYRGELFVPGNPGIFDFLKRVSNWTSIQNDWSRVKEFMLEKGANTFGTIGTCWGSYPVVRLSTLPDFKAGVSMHPSHSPIMAKLDENESDILKEVKSPQLMMPSKTDSANVKTGGLAEQILGDNVTIIEFPEMSHGWTTRGKLSDPAIHRDVHLAISEALNFFNKHL